MCARCGCRLSRYSERGAELCAPCRSAVGRAIAERAALLADGCRGTKRLRAAYAQAQGEHPYGAAWRSTITGFNPHDRV